MGAPVSGGWIFVALLLASGASGFAILRFADVGPLARHMGLHILLMSLLAPLVALLWQATRQGWLASGRSLLYATIAQLVALWAMHAPGAIHAGMHNPAIAFAGLAVLLVTAVWFWGAVLGQRRFERWRALAALLVTGKLFCLLAAILVFSPRVLYPMPTAPAGGSAMADQQFAGLLMIVLCPLTYIVAAIVISSRWLKEMAAAEPSPVAGPDA